MFSFHKPRVYRSTEGCCICRAKSSSSRFTDSKKYEDDSVKCFNLEKPRQGEICNACVLLVKRFKRLPAGSNRHWGHVVDARIGPGMKSMTKFKKLREESQQTSAGDNGTSTKAHNTKSSSSSSSIPEKFCKIFKKNKKKKLLEKSIITTKDKREGSPGSWDEQSLPPTPESLNSDGEEIRYSSNNYNNNNNNNKHNSNIVRAKLSRNRINRRKIRKPRRYHGKFDNINFFDEIDWKPIKSCCGIVYEHTQFRAIIIDIQKCKPCSDHHHYFESKHSLSHVKTDKNINSVAIASEESLHELKKYQLHLDRSVLTANNNNNNANGVMTTITKEETAFVAPVVFVGPTTATTGTTTTPALKKHHLFFKRQLENFPNGNITAATMMTNVIKSNMITTKTDLDHTSNISRQIIEDHHPHAHANDMQSIKATTIINPITTVPEITTKVKTTLLHKIKSDTGKIVKHSLDKINTLRMKQADLSDIKNLIKITDKPIKIRTLDDTSSVSICPTGGQIIHKQQQQVDQPGNKFSDNSSDSGFDENLQDRKSVSPLQEVDEKEKKVIIRPAQAMFLANGVQIQSQPQNIILTASDVAAKMLQSRRQGQLSTTTTKYAQNSGSQKIRAIFNQSSESGATSIVTLATAPSMGSLVSAISSSSGSTNNTSTSANLNNNAAMLNVVAPSTATSLNQKIIFVKTKYNNNQSTSLN